MATAKRTQTTYRLTVNGTEYTVTTSRKYTHALIDPTPVGGDSAFWSWHTSAELAEKARRNVERQTHGAGGSTLAVVAL